MNRTATAMRMKTYASILTSNQNLILCARSVCVKREQVHVGTAASAFQSSEA
jgi:hypothetical protein